MFEYDFAASVPGSIDKLWCCVFQTSILLALCKLLFRSLLCSCTTAAPVRADCLLREPREADVHTHRALNIPSRNRRRYHFMEDEAVSAEGNDLVL